MPLLASPVQSSVPLPSVGSCLMGCFDHSVLDPVVFLVALLAGLYGGVSGDPHSEFLELACGE